jgi:hypothetical protein
MDDVGSKDFRLGAGVLGLLAVIAIILMLVS